MTELEPQRKVRHAETCWVSLHNYQALDIISWTYYITQ